MKRYLEIDDRVTFLAGGLDIKLDGDAILNLPTLKDLLASLRERLGLRLTETNYSSKDLFEAIKELDRFCKEE